MELIHIIGQRRYTDRKKNEITSHKNKIRLKIKNNTNNNNNHNVINNNNYYIIITWSTRNPVSKQASIFICQI